MSHTKEGLELPVDLRSQVEEDSFRNENSQVFYCVQSSLMNTNLAGLSISSLKLNTLLRYTKCLFSPLTISISTSFAASQPTKVPTRLVRLGYDSWSCRQKSKRRRNRGRGWEAPTWLVGWGYDSRKLQVRD